MKRSTIDSSVKNSSTALHYAQAGERALVIDPESSRFGEVIIAVTGPKRYAASELGDCNDWAGLLLNVIDEDEGSNYVARSSMLLPLRDDDYREIARQATLANLTMPSENPSAYMPSKSAALASTNFRAEFVTPLCSISPDVAP